MPRGEVVVVGGGLAGLMVAALVGRAGARVRVLEAGESLGGRARSRAQEGFHLNQGAHAMFTGGPVDRVLRRLDVKLRGGVVVPSHGRVMHAQRLHALPAGPWSLLTSELIDARSKRELFSFLARPPKAQSISPETSLRAYLDEHFSSDSATEFLEMLVRLTSFTDAPQTTSARDVLAHLTLTMRGKTLYLHGGWQALVDDLRRAVEGCGGIVQAAQRATGIRHSRGRVTGVEVEGGGDLPADAVVLAVSPRHAAALAHDAPELHAAAEAARPVRVSCLDVGLARLPRPDVTYVLGFEEPLYFAVHSRYAELAPPGAALAQLMRYLRPSEGGRVRELEAFLDLLQPGWEGEVRLKQELPEMVASHWWPRVDARRPPEAVASMEGLFVAGDWVGSEGLLAQASAASAERAAELVVAHLSRHAAQRAASPASCPPRGVRA